jgi:LytR cell envelope-related transcriptional attenuator
VEHAQPLNRVFQWRTIALAASVVALGAGSVVALVDRPTVAGLQPGAHQAAKGPALPPLRPRSRVSVLVLNGNGTSGVAGATATRLLGRGYRSATATNAQTDSYATSLVLYRRGWEPEAQRLAKDAHVKVVAALDGRLPSGSARDQLVLILGAN